MTTSVRTAVLAVLFCSSAHAHAEADRRIRAVPYVADQVTEIKVQRGTATRIVLGDDERILPDGAATGFATDCTKPGLEWCMRAQPGDNQVLIKPQDGATHNNLELRTNKRDYSFRFEVVVDPSPSSDPVKRTTSQTQTPTHRLTFLYPPHALAQREAAPLPVQKIPPPPSPREILLAARPSPRNWQYSMQAMAGSEDIVPDIAFDDGRFTYFQFPANREMPTIFYVSAAGEEGRVNFHLDEQSPDIVVVERMSRRFMLRLGNAAIGIWNDAFDSYGVPPRDGTTVDGIARTMRKE